MDSATPSINPMIFIFTPRILDKNNGMILITISLEISMKKLVRLTAQMLRGRSLMGVLDFSVFMPTPR
ncbi:MAG: hypothetical protein Q7J07_02180 [Pelolinea sp.]|nr:hypothetical protein [Pelolinea sp.]